MKLKQMFLTCGVVSLSIHGASLLIAADDGASFMQDLGGRPPEVSVRIVPEQGLHSRSQLPIQQPMLATERTTSRGRETNTRPLVVANTVELTFSEWKKECHRALNVALYPTDRLSPSAHQGEFLSLMDSFGIQPETEANWHSLWAQLSKFEKLSKRKVSKRGVTRGLFKEIDGYMTDLLSQEGDLQEKREALIQFINDIVDSKRLNFQARTERTKRSGRGTSFAGRKPGRYLKDHIKEELDAYYEDCQGKTKKPRLTQAECLTTISEIAEESVFLAEDALWPELGGGDEGAISTAQLNAKRARTPSPSPIWGEVDGFVTVIP